MATQASSGTSGTSGTTGTQDAASTTLGVGGTTSGQAGATPSHETMQETGGSGGAQLTQSTGEIDAPPGSKAQDSPAAPETKPEADGSAVQSGSRGALDTRSQQAGGTGTGLGSPETGANQSPDDLPPAP
jgi:hypothetical protein